MLAWTIYSSFIGAAMVLLLPRRYVRVTALTTALVGLTITLFSIASVYEHATAGLLAPITNVVWVSQLGIHYHLASDGITLTLVLLTSIAALAGVLFSWSVEQRTKEFFALYFVLIGGVYGVFLSFDLFLLLVFYEIAI